MSIDFYKNLLETKNGVEALGWKSKESQEIRFKILAGIGSLHNKSILDVGCGYGDFYFYLNDETIKYTGYDFNPEIIKIAKNKYPNIELTTSFPDKMFDWIFASGIFNIQAKDWDKISKELIVKMWEHCNLGIAYNMLSIYAEKKDPVSHYADPLNEIKFCEKLTKKYILRSDYKINDFTIYLYK